jgi:putative NADH-flavin reductase
MRITVFGSSGAVGREVVTEARARGHHVTEVTRAVGDAANPDHVAELAKDSDVVIGATRPAPGHEPDLVKNTLGLLAGTARAGVRLLLVGGAATLKVPGGTVLDDLPEALRPIANACAEQHAVCLADTVADWTYVSPPALLEPGERTGRYRLGADELLVDADGNSAISTADFAVALLDEAERPAHRRSRFTVAY